MNRWLPPTIPDGSWLQLFCLPYAGAGASLFRGWTTYFSTFGIAVRAVQLPGREQRLSEPALTDVHELVAGLAAARDSRLPFAVYGHSMGALIGYEFARRQRADGRDFPVHLFVAACRAPDIPDPLPHLHALDRAALVAELTRYGGTPAEALEHPHLLDLLENTLRADAAVTERYEYRPQPPLACPITVFAGAHDHLVTESESGAWRAHTSADFALMSLPDGHFLASQGRTVQSTIAAALLPLRSRLSPLSPGHNR